MARLAAVLVALGAFFLTSGAIAQKGGSQAGICVDGAGNPTLGLRHGVRYHTWLGEQDRFNSRGVRLTTALQVLRQDRANLHRFNRGDARDELAGNYFAETVDRAVFDSASLITVCSDSPERIAQGILQGSIQYVEVHHYWTPTGVNFFAVIQAQ